MFKKTRPNSFTQIVGNSYDKVMYGGKQPYHNYDHEVIVVWHNKPEPKSYFFKTRQLANYFMLKQMKRMSK